MNPTITNPSGTILQNNVTPSEELSMLWPTAIHPRKPTIVPGKIARMPIMTALRNLIISPIQPSCYLFTA